jgi:hypothetical protein
MAVGVPIPSLATTSITSLVSGIRFYPGGTVTKGTEDIRGMNIELATGGRQNSLAPFVRIITCNAGSGLLPEWKRIRSKTVPK